MQEQEAPQVACVLKSPGMPMAHAFCSPAMPLFARLHNWLRWAPTGPTPRQALLARLEDHVPAFVEACCTLAPDAVCESPLLLAHAFRHFVRHAEPGVHGEFVHTLLQVVIRALWRKSGALVSLFGDPEHPLGLAGLRLHRFPVDGEGARAA